MNLQEIQFYWARSLRSLKSAQALIELDCMEDSISRSYYAVLYSAKAALLVHDVSASSHTAARRLFGLHLIKTQKIEREWSDIFLNIYDARGIADYDSAYMAAQEDASEILESAARFVHRMRRYLESCGIVLPIPFPYNQYFSGEHNTQSKEEPK